MTATDQMRAMLDQLMGTSRNGKTQQKYQFALSNNIYSGVLINWFCSQFVYFPPIWNAKTTHSRAHNAGEGDRFTLKFNDPKVCKSFLLECCPHEILASTVS